MVGLFQNVMNPVGNATGAGVDAVVFAASTSRSEACHAVDVPASIRRILAEQTTSTVTSAGILFLQKKDMTA